MKFTKVLVVLAFLVLLAGAVDALSVASYWLDSGQSTSKTINYGASDDFYFKFTSFNRSSNAQIDDITIKLYNSNGQVVYTFEEDETVKGRRYEWDYEVNSNVYGSAGDYEIRISGSSVFKGVRYRDDTAISLTVLPQRDTTPPVITINSPKNGKVYSEHVTRLSYTVSDNSGVIFKCWYSTNAESTPSKPAACSDFSVKSIEGTNTWTVYAMDSSSNTGSASVTFNVEMPVTELNVSGRWYETGNVLGGQSRTIYDGENVAFNAVAESVHPPVTDINIKLYSSNGQVVYTFEEGRINDGSFSWDYKINENIYSEPGDYKVKISASDSNNQDSHVLTLRVLPERDETPPVITINSPKNGKVYSEHVTRLSYTVSDNSGQLGSCWYSTDGGRTNSSISGCSGPFSVTSIEGTNTWTVYASDTSGNVASASVTFNVEMPVTELNVSGRWYETGNVLGGQSRTIYDGENVAFNAVAESVHPPVTDINIKLYSSNGQVVYTFEEGRINDGSFSWDYKINENIYSEPGDYKVKISASDSNNQDSHVLTLRVLPERDETPPVITINSPKNGKVYSEHVTRLSYTVSDNSGQLGSCWYSTDGGRTNSSISGCSGPFSVTSIEGTNTWTVYASDTSGNVASASVTFTVGIEAPEPKDDDDDDGKSRKNNYVFVDIVSEEEYMDQFSPRNVIIESEEDEEPEVKLSFWERIIKFFKELLGLK